MGGVSSGQEAVAHPLWEMEMCCAASLVECPVSLLRQWLASHSDFGISKQINFSLMVKEALTVFHCLFCLQPLSFSRLILKDFFDRLPLAFLKLPPSFLTLPSLMCQIQNLPFLDTGPISFSQLVRNQLIPKGRWYDQNSLSTPTFKIFFLLTVSISVCTVWFLNYFKQILQCDIAWKDTTSEIILICNYNTT